jgi:hypothetical protein
MTALDTVFILLVAILLPAAGGVVQRFSSAVRVTRYRSMFAILLGLAIATVAVWGVPGRSLASLGLRLPSTSGFGWALVVTAGLVVLLVGYAVYLLRPVRAERTRRHLAPVRGLLPATRGELGWYVAVGVVASVSEELLYRGYLLLAIQPGGPLVALAISTILFGAHHLYQGLGGAIRVAVFGLALGVMTLVAGSILPAIIVHAVQDLTTGLLAYRLLADTPGQTTDAG